MGNLLSKAANRKSNSCASAGCLSRPSRIRSTSASASASDHYFLQHRTRSSCDSRPEPSGRILRFLSIRESLPTSIFIKKAVSTRFALRLPQQAGRKMARVYADVNQQMPRAYWDYDSVNITWGVLENYEVVRKIGKSATPLSPRLGFFGFTRSWLCVCCLLTLGRVLV